MFSIIQQQFPPTPPPPPKPGLGELYLHSLSRLLFITLYRIPDLVLNQCGNPISSPLIQCLYRGQSWNSNSTAQETCPHVWHFHFRVIVENPASEHCCDLTWITARVLLLKRCNKCNPNQPSHWKGDSSSKRSRTALNGAFGPFNNSVFKWVWE